MQTQGCFLVGNTVVLIKCFHGLAPLRYVLPYTQN